MESRAELRGIEINTDGCDVDDLVFCGAVTATLAADEPWDEFVALAVREGWVGVEALSGVAGTVGTVVAANVERYGQSSGDVVASVRTWDRSIDAQRTFAWADCRFAHGSSRFSTDKLDDGLPRYRVIEVSLLLKQGDLVVTTPGLAPVVGVVAGERVPLPEVRDRVLAGVAGSRQ